MKSFLGNLFRLLLPVLAAGVCLTATLLILAAFGYGRPEGGSFADGVRAIARVVHQRSLLPGRNYRFWVQTLLATTPLIFTGLAVAVAFRASVLNIGAEGQYVVGAILATAVGVHMHGPPALVIPMMMLAAMVGGGAFAGFAQLLQQWRQVPVVLSTLLLNFVAIELLRTMLQGPLHEKTEIGASGSTVGQVQSDQLPEIARLAHVHLDGHLAHWLDHTFSSIIASRSTPVITDLHHGLFIALLAALVVLIILHVTTFGFRLRAVGENATAARFAGINVGRVALASLALSGALAGLAGAVQVSGVRPYQLQLAASQGFGFTGIAVALLGRLSPVGVVLAAIFFGWLNTAFAQLQSQLNIPAATALAAQGAILLVMLVLMREGR